MPFIAHAGLFSFVADAFSTSGASVNEKKEANTQTMAILKAPLPGELVSEVTIVSDSVLAPGLTSVNTGGSVIYGNSSRIYTYVVKPGDTLSQIADMYDVSINTIKWANDIENGIRPGDMLVILPISGVRHTVEKGETLKGIATKYHGDIDDIIAYNGLVDAGSIKVGDVVVIPDGEVSAPKSSSPASSRSIAGKVADTVKNAVGYYMRPTAGPKTQGIHGNNAVDFGGSLNSPIYAAASGRVIVSKNDGWNGGYGSYIVISHDNGTQTLYAHLNETIVSVGQTVSRGETIGRMGRTGKVYGPTGIHLHFEVRGAKNPY